MATHERALRIRATCRALGCAVFAVLLLTPSVQGEGREGGRTERTQGEWTLQHPIVIGSAEMGPRVRFMNLFPMGIVWLENVPVVAVMKDPKVSPALILWKEDTDRSWATYAKLPGISFPSVFAIDGKGIGVVGLVGGNVRSGNNSAIHFLRVQDGKTAKPHVLVPVGKTYSRVTVSTVEVSGNTIFVFLLGEIRGKPRNHLLFASSGDGGRSWSDVRKIGDTTMHEDDSHVRGLCFSDRHVARFVTEREGVFLYRSRDAGKTWKKEPFTVQDGLGKTERLPLGTVMLRDAVGVVYLAHNPKNRREAKYLFTRSSDQGMRWGKGTAITENTKFDDPSLFVQVARAGDRIAFSYMETVGNWTKGEIENHVIVSRDNGETWVREPLSKYYNGVMLFSALSGAPDGSRLLYNTAIRMKTGVTTRCFLVVQEYSGRVIADATAATLERLVTDLGHAKYTVREAASKRLAASGARAHKELLKAAKSRDPEVSMRARELIKLLFPECIKLAIDE